MLFKTETVTLRDTEFEVRELSIRDLMPVIKLLETDPVEGQNKLMSKAVCLDGEPMGEAYMDLPAAMMMELLPRGLEVNNLGEEEQAKKS